MTDQTKEQAAQPGTEIALLPPPERAALVLKSTETEKTLRELVQKSADITAVSDAAGRELAHRSGMNLKNARVAIEKAGKAARDDANAFNAAVIAEQKRLVGITEKEEERIFGLRDGYDTKAKAEKEERERKERERVAAIQAKLNDIRALPMQSASDTAAQLQATYDDLLGFTPTEEDFAEFVTEAAQARDNALGILSTLLESAKTREAEAARLAAERAAQEAEARRMAEQRAELERQQQELARQRAELEAASKPQAAPLNSPGRWRDGEPGPGTEEHDEIDDLFDRSEHPQRVLVVAEQFIDAALAVSAAQPHDFIPARDSTTVTLTMPHENAAPTGYWCNGEYWGTTPDGDGKAAEFIGQELKLTPFWTHGRDVTFVVDGEAGTGRAIMTPATPEDSADLLRSSLDAGQ